MVTSDKIRHTGGDGNFQKWFVIGVWQWLLEGGRGDDAAVMFYEVKNGCNLVLIKSELGASKNILIFRKDAGIKGESQFARGHHAHNFSARTKRRQQAGDQNICVKDDFHRVRLTRAALIS